jgi:ribosomal RNA assembly protein
MSRVERPVSKMIDFVNIPDQRAKILRENRLAYNRKIRDFLDVKISVKDDVEVEGEDALVVMRAKEVVRAFGRGFDWEDALDMVDEDYMLDVIDMTQFTGKSRNRQVVLKGRVIGSEGRSKKIIEKYSGAKIAVYGKTVSVMGKWESVRVARQAVEDLLRGAKHTGVFKGLEERRVA